MNHHEMSVGSTDEKHIYCWRCGKTVVDGTECEGRATTIYAEQDVENALINSITDKTYRSLNKPMLIGRVNRDNFDLESVYTANPTITTPKFNWWQKLLRKLFRVV